MRTPADMEDALQNIDRRLTVVEQILPTLATRAELRDEIRGVRVLIEDVRGDVKVVHDRIDIEMAGLNRRMDERFDAMQAQFGGLQTLFDAMQMQLAEVLRRLPPP